LGVGDTIIPGNWNALIRFGEMQAGSLILQFGESVMKHWLAGGLLVSAAVWALGADDQRKSPPAGNLASQVNQLEKEYRAKKAEFRVEIRERTSSHPENYVKEFRAYSISAGKKFLELARQNPEDPASFKALTIAFAALDEQVEQKEVVKLLAKHHIETAGIGDIAVSHAYDDDPGNLSFAHEILKKNQNAEDQASALLAIGLINRRKAGQENATDEDRAKAMLEAAKAFELVKAKYAHLKPAKGKSLAEKADEYLAGLKNVARFVVGKESPDIEGEDLDGKSFKLSDYRGKVVLLDYWAHW
jgi:hypothetical protein